MSFSTTEALPSESTPLIQNAQGNMGAGLLAQVGSMSPDGIAQIQGMLASADPETKARFLSNLPPEQQALVKGMEGMAPEQVAGVMEGMSSMMSGGPMKAEALAQLIKPARGKSAEELSGMTSMLPEQFAFAVPLIQPLSNIDDEQLVPLLQAMLDLKDSQGKGKKTLPTESIIKGHAAFKDIPEGTRGGLIHALKSAESLREYHAFAEAGAETVVHLSEDDLKQLVDDYNNNNGEVSYHLWAQVIAKSEARDLQQWILDGPFGIRVLSFFAGILLLISGFAGIITGMVFGHWWVSLINFWVVFMAIITLVMECKCTICKFLLRRTVEAEVQMLSTVEGRGWFYVFCCTLCLCQWGQEEQLLNLVAGWVMLAVGLLNILSGVMGKRKLLQARAHFVTTDASGMALDEAVLEGKLDDAFDAADHDFSGDLDREELKVLLLDFSVELRDSELESVIMLLDKDCDGRISREEVKAWYLAETHAQMEKAADAIAFHARQMEINAMPPGPSRDAEQSALNGDASTPVLADFRATWELLQNGPCALSLLSTLGGFALLLAGCGGIWDALANIDRETSFAELLTNAYVISIGLFAIALEIPHLKNLQWARKVVDANIAMLRLLWGRGLIYTLAALLLLVQVWVDSEMRMIFVVVGAYELILGCLTMCFGLTLARKLSGLKDQLEDEAMIDAKFNQCALDENRELDSVNFPLFLQKFNVNLGYNELCATIRELDTDKNGKISLDEFKRWYGNRLLKVPGFHGKSSAEHSTSELSSPLSQPAPTETA